MSDTSRSLNKQEEELILLTQSLRVACIDSNDALQRDLNQLWRQQHLTANDQIGIFDCPACKVDGKETCDNLAYYIARDGKQWTANTGLIAAFGEIRSKYTFTELEAWPCGDACGTILFERKINGIVCDMTSASGPSSGIVSGYEANDGPMMTIQ
jgi:hypothetical protein